MGCCASRDNGRPKTNVLASSDKSRALLNERKKNLANMETMVQETIAKGKPWTDE